MRLSKIALSLGVAITFLASCGNNEANKYTLTFYQDHGNHFDDYEVFIGKTTFDEIKTFANSLTDYTKTGYDRSWDWDHFNFETQTEDWTIDALYSKHKYTISFKYNDEEIATSTYEMGDTVYDVPVMVPKEAGYEYAYDLPSIEGKHEDIIVTMTLKRLTYQLKFYYNVDDLNPTIVTYSYDDTIITTPSGLEGYDCTWKSNDKTVSLEAGKQVDLRDIVGEDKLGNYSLYLDKVGKPYTISFNANGGEMEGESTKQVIFGDIVDLPIPTFKGSSSFLGWFDSKTGELVENGKPYSIADNSSLIARYVLTFEDEASKNLLIKGARNTIESKDLDDTSKTHGSKSLKIKSSNASTTFSCGFDSDFITSAFADPNVVAIDFDAKGSVKCTKLSQQNNVTSAYENKNLDNAEGFGLDTIWKTFEITKEEYQACSDKTSLIWTVGGQLPLGGYIWIDNVRPVSKNLDYFGFECSRMVDYQPDSTWYDKNVSIRNFDGQEIFTIGQNSSAKDCYFGFDYEIKSEGNRSIKYHRDSNCWCNLNVLSSRVNWDEITFDICLSIAYNGNTLRYGNGKELFPTTRVIPAMEWTTFTVSRAFASADGNCFATFSGSPIFDFWIDNLQVKLKTAA